MNRKLLRKKPRAFLLLEVLIAFLLVVLCVFPLITPHIAIYKDQLAFANKIGLDHAISEVYANIIEQLHRNTIPWNAFTEKTKFPIPKNSLFSFKNVPLPYEGYYQFTEIKHKPPEPKPFTVYLFNLTFKIMPLKAGDHEIEYKYQVFIPRQLQGETPEPPEENKPEPKKKSEEPKKT